MAIYVINEWLWHDSFGDNGRDGQRRAVAAIAKLSASADRIVVIERSPFDQKTWASCKSGDGIAKALGRLYVTSLRQNADRCILLDGENDLKVLPGNLAAQIKPDDYYLVRAQLTVTGAILVTTDMPLREIVLQAGLACLTREEFLGQALTTGTEGIA